MIYQQDLYDGDNYGSHYSDSIRLASGTGSRNSANYAIMEENANRGEQNDYLLNHDLCRIYQLRAKIGEL